MYIQPWFTQLTLAVSTIVRYNAKPMRSTNSLLVHSRAPIIPSGSPRNGKSMCTGIAPHRIVPAFARHRFLREKCYSETASQVFVPPLCLQHCARSVSPYKAQCTVVIEALPTVQE
jgi:hypothetical protein